MIGNGAVQAHQCQAVTNRTGTSPSARRIARAVAIDADSAGERPRSWRRRGGGQCGGAWIAQTTRAYFGASSERRWEPGAHHEVPRRNLSVLTES